MLDRAIDAFTGRLVGPTPPPQRRKSIKSIELSIADELGDGAGNLTGSEAYHLVIGPDSVALTGLDVPALRAGLVSLARLLDDKDGLSVLPGGQMTDWPNLPLRGFHLDLSCQVLDYDYVCGLLERLAGYKFNAILLEWGDKFPYQGHRALSHPDAFTPRQVSQLLDLCEGLGLVVIPLVQTLGHAEFILRHPQFAHLSEVPGEIYQLATANPESLVLSKQLVDQLIESHPNSPYIHLGADEAVQLGGALDCLIRRRVELQGVANGQRVPEDWHRPDADALVERALECARSPQPTPFSFDEAELAMLMAVRPPHMRGMNRFVETHDV